MNKGERFENILTKIILPQYPEFYEVKVVVHGDIGEIYFYSVRYFSVQKPSSKMMQRVSDETVSLFHMLGEKKGSDLQVYFVDSLRVRRIK